MEDLLPSPDAGPEAARVRATCSARRARSRRIDELPEEQRDVFVAHEIEGHSFKEMAAETGVSMNTLLSRKRYAVLRLRERLQRIHDEFIGKRGDNVRRRRWIFFVPLAIAGFVAFIIAGGVIVQFLWNWLAPALFGWHEITSGRRSGC